MSHTALRGAPCSPSTSGSSRSLATRASPGASPSRGLLHASTSRGHHQHRASPLRAAQSPSLGSTDEERLRGLAASGLERPAAAAKGLEPSSPRPEPAPWSLDWPRDFAQRYRLGDFINEGSFGRVYKATDRENEANEPVAVKILSKLREGIEAERYKKKILQEVRCARRPGWRTYWEGRASRIDARGEFDRDMLTRRRGTHGSVLTGPQQRTS